MAGILSSPMAYDPSWIEATVTKVDPKRYVCSIRTTKGQVFSDVSWTRPPGSQGTPVFGQLVLVSTVLGYPLIIGEIPKLGLSTGEAQSSSGMATDSEVGNSSTLRNGYTLNPDGPSDLLPGDKITSNPKGGSFGLLTHGTFFAKAGSLAQIILSRFNNVVRIVSQTLNFNADPGQFVLANIRGRLYGFFGIDRKLSKSRYGSYEYVEYYGDVAAGESGKGEPSNDISPAARDTRVRAFKLTGDVGGTEVMTEVLYEDGKLVVTVSGGSTTIQTHDNGLWKVDCNGTAIVTIDPDTVSAVVHGNSSAVVKPDSITTNVSGANTVTKADSIRSMVGGTQINMDSNMAEMVSGGHRVGVDSSGVRLS